MFIGAVSHVLLIIPAIPSVIKSGNALAPFLISIYILSLASGLIKPTLAPILVDQSPIKKPVVTTTKSGERVGIQNDPCFSVCHVGCVLKKKRTALFKQVIMSPQVTVQRYLLVFYWCINIGAFFGLATSYAAVRPRLAARKSTA